MKKLLIAKLAVVTLSFAGLIACNNGDNPGPGPTPPGPEPTVYHTLTFSGDHCVMKDSKGNEIKEPVKFEAGQTANFYLDGEEEGWLLPTEEDVKAYVTGSEETFEGTWKYNPNDGALSVKMTADVTVTATSDPDLDNYRLITFEGTDCVMKNGEDEESITEALVKKDSEVKYKLEGETDFFLIPVNEHVSVTYTESGESYKEGYTYDEDNGLIGFKATDNITIAASSLAKIPTTEGYISFYFKLGASSVPFEEYESVYFTGGLGPTFEWKEGTEALPFNQHEEHTDYYYFQIDKDILSDDIESYGQYQIVKGLNDKSGVTEDKQGLIWKEAYKSDECRAAKKSPLENPSFDPAPKKYPIINLGTHTFSTTVVIPSDEPLKDYTLSVEFAEAVPNDCKVLIFGNMSGEWVTPSGQGTEEDIKIIEAAKMTLDLTSSGKIFTYTYPQLCPDIYDYLICVESNESVAKITWNKLFECEDDLSFGVHQEDGDNFTNKLFTGDHCAHFKDPLGYVVIPFESTDITHGTVEISGYSHRPLEKVNATVIPDDGYTAPENDTGIVFYTNQDCSDAIPVKIEKYDASAGTFVFSLPDDKYDTYYVEVYCHNGKESCSITTKDVANEECTSKPLVEYGSKVTITFQNAAKGFHIAKDNGEFFSTHHIIGAYSNQEYTYANDVGTLTFTALSNIIIKGSAPSDI